MNVRNRDFRVEHWRQLLMERDECVSEIYVSKIEARFSAEVL